MDLLRLHPSGRIYYASNCLRIIKIREGFHFSLSVILVNNDVVIFQQLNFVETEFTIVRELVNTWENV